MKWMVVIRDLIAILIGAFGLVHSQVTGNIYPELLVIYTALIGSPLAIRLLEKRSGKTSGSTDSS
jgi:hypothetical protein